MIVYKCWKALVIVNKYRTCGNHLNVDHILESNKMYKHSTVFLFDKLPGLDNTWFNEYKLGQI